MSCLGLGFLQSQGLQVPMGSRWWPPLVWCWGTKRLYRIRARGLLPPHCVLLYGCGTPIMALPLVPKMLAGVPMGDGGQCMPALPCPGEWKS